MIYSPLSCLRGGKSGVGSSGNPVSEGNGTRNFVSRLCNLGAETIRCQFIIDVTDKSPE